MALTPHPPFPSREASAAAGDAPLHARGGDAVALEQALTQARARTLGMVEAWRRQLGDGLDVIYDENLNPLRWELGHVGWFEAWWLARNPQRDAGHRADPQAPRSAPTRAGADAWYDSSRVEHRSRWSLGLPPVAAIVDDLAWEREGTLALLRQADSGDDALYFFRLALHHEHMHGEAWVMMAQRLGLAPGDALASTPAQRFDLDAPELELAAGEIELGVMSPGGFVFDNEWGHHLERHGAFGIDAQPVTWRRFLPFVDAGGYTDPRWWDEAGRAWLEAWGLRQPAILRRTCDDRWEQRHFDHWLDVDPAHAAVHLTMHEAQAWCRWAGRALPTEAQWQAARRHHGHAFRHGEVWEWTASPFAPFEGFEPHPYRDYSQPWFDGRPVLLGGSAWAHPQMRYPGYRNFFRAARNDVRAGFRSVRPSRAPHPVPAKAGFERAA